MTKEELDTIKRHFYSYSITKADDILMVYKLLEYIDDLEADLDLERSINET